MERYIVEQKLKSAAAFLVIIILLPYIVSVFVNGADVTAGAGSSSFWQGNSSWRDGSRERKEPAGIL